MTTRPYRITITTTTGRRQLEGGSYATLAAAIRRAQRYASLRPDETRTIRHVSQGTVRCTYHHGHPRTWTV